MERGGKEEGERKGEGGKEWEGAGAGGEETACASGQASRREVFSSSMGGECWCCSRQTS